MVSSDKVQYVTDMRIVTLQQKSEPRAHWKLVSCGRDVALKQKGQTEQPKKDDTHLHILVSRE